MMIPYQKAQVSFKKGAMIGQDGENSEVYIAHDEHLDAYLAIKQIKTDGFNEEGYLEEAQNLYKSAHPYVVQVLYACKDAQHIYIAMPHYKNGSLKALSNKGDLTAKRIIRYSIQFLSGLNNIHSKGLIHFDIKSDNILISDNDEALISDFGFAKNMDISGYATPDASYVQHSPPEATTSDDLDNRSDIYQVGLTLYRLFAGDNSLELQRAKFTNGAELVRALRNESYPDHKQYPPHTPSSIIKIIKKCLKYDPDKRYNSVIELLNALSSIEDNGLDWKMTEDDTCTQWDANSTDGYAYRLKLNHNGVSEAWKRTDGGAFRKFGQYCKQDASKEDIHEALMSPKW